MKCPNCKIDIELSWARYFKSAFSRFVCPGCSTRFKFKRPFKWYLWYFSWVVSYFITIGLVAMYGDINFIWLNFAIVSSILMAIYFVVDRRMESNFETKSI